MTDALWTLLFAQIAMGAFDTIWHHEGTERLAWRPGQRTELRLHGVRNLAYALLFLALGFTRPQGLWAAALMLLLAGEMIITLWDFVEEDRTRRLPASERITHTLLTLNYGALLALLLPWLWQGVGQATALVPADHGLAGWLCALAAAGVMGSGLRDLAAAQRAPQLVDAPAAGLASALPGRQHLLITGGTGFIGQRLVAALAAAGHDVTILSRSATAPAVSGTGRVKMVTNLATVPADCRIDAIVNLAGEPISDRPWTRAKRIRIIRSRLAVTRAVVALIDRLDHKPAVLVSGSAIGIYGLQDDDFLDENAAGRPCFSARVCRNWEAAAARASTRTVMLRTGLVLDRSGGLLSRLLAPFEFGLGGRLGSGRQWMSWIHRDDLVRLIIHAIANEQISGPLNATAPHPVTNAEFTRTLGQLLRRPTLIPVSAAPLTALLGDFARELLLGGQRVQPSAALASGFRFRHPSLAGALAAITGQPDPQRAALQAAARSLAAICDGQVDTGRAPA
jgi:uncharacterized protein (TIGR01777 family)